MNTLTWKVNNNIYLRLNMIVSWWSRTLLSKLKRNNSNFSNDSYRNKSSIVISKYINIFTNLLIIDKYKELLINKICILGEETSMDIQIQHWNQTITHKRKYVYGYYRSNQQTKKIKNHFVWKGTLKWMSRTLQNIT
jgi:hypothetical protein